MEPSSSRPRQVQSLSRAFALLTAIGNSAGGARLSDLADRTGLHRSTAHNLLATLESLGYICQPVAGGPYIVTDLVADLHRSATGGDTALKARLHPLLEEVVALTGETCCLAVPAGQDYLCIDVVETRQPLRLTIEAGSRERMLGTAIGHLFLANRPESEAVVFNRDPEEWLKWLPLIEDARATGVALEFETYRPDMACAAVPFRENGKVGAALCVIGPSSRLLEEKLREIAEIVNRVVSMSLR